MLDIGPKDTIEAMLAAQMVAIHNLAMDSFGKAAAASDYRCLQGMYLEHGLRLANMMTRQAERALN